MGLASPRSEAISEFAAGGLLRLVAISGRRAARSTRRGLVVAPGWVDVHSHFEGQATWDPLLCPSGQHGVTTTVMGNCGIGFAPARPRDHEALITLMEGVDYIWMSWFGGAGLVKYSRAGGRASKLQPEPDGDTPGAEDIVLDDSSIYWIEAVGGTPRYIKTMAK